MTVTIGELVAELDAAFAETGIDSPRLDARILVAHVLGVDPARLFAAALEPFPPERRAALDVAAARRLAGEPVARIRGRREFWGLDFTIAPATLDPRADTETLIAAAAACLEARKDEPLRILDLGTGSGNILLAMLTVFPRATGVGVDIAADALDVAAGNAERLGLTARASFLRGHWAEGLSDRFDVIVSNPPYISDADFFALPREVALFDPPAALRGGADGLECYRALVPQAARLIADDGTLLLEVGSGQAESVAALCRANNFLRTAFYDDLAGIQRVVGAVCRGV